MPGMFSMMQGSHARLDALAGQGLADESMERRSSVNRSPMSSRRDFGNRSSKCKVDQLPKKYRSTRCKEIHPLLRRSVCTLILSLLSIVLGLTLTLIEFFGGNPQISVVGVTFMGLGIVLLVGGAVWLHCSKKQLKVIETKLSEIRKTQITKNKSTSIAYSKEALKKVHESNKLSLQYKHAKWPTKKVSISSFTTDQISDVTFHREESSQDILYMGECVTKELPIEQQKIEKNVKKLRAEIPFMQERSSSVPQVFVPSLLNKSAAGRNSDIPIIRVGNCSPDNEKSAVRNNASTTIDEATIEELATTKL